MRKELTQLLYEQYPGLYERANLPMQQSNMYFGFSCHDGWFSLIDAISDTIMAVDPLCKAVQVKEKFGTLTGC